MILRLRKCSQIHFNDFLLCKHSLPLKVVVVDELVLLSRLWQVTKPNPADCLWERGAQARLGRVSSVEIYNANTLFHVTTASDWARQHTWSLFVPLQPSTGLMGASDKCYCDVCGWWCQLNSQMVTIKTISNIEIIRCLKTSKWQTKYKRHCHCIIRNQVKSVH